MADKKFVIILREEDNDYLADELTPRMVKEMFSDYNWIVDSVKEKPVKEDKK